MKRLMGVAAVAVVVTGAVVGLWWKPWQSPVALPKSACWGILGPSDIRPVVGTSGMAKSVSQGNLLPSWMIPGGANGDPFPTECDITWNGNVVGRANVSASDAGVEGWVSQSQVKPVTLAPGIVMLPEDSGVMVFFRCDRMKPKFIYVEAEAVNGGITAQYSPTEAERNGYADIALKLAEAAAPEIHCNNPLTFPAAVPQLVPYPKY